jgi:hypothetical protein
MINLKGTLDTLKLVTSSTADIHIHISWVSYIAGTPTPDRDNLITTTATTTTLITAPSGATDIKNLKCINARNKHASTSNTLTFQIDNGTVYQLFSLTLLAGECVEYVEGQGWRVYDAAGQPKVGVLAVDPSQNSFRLTGTSATPVMTADSTSLGTIYLTPYRGNAIALYDGTNWQVVSSAEVSLAVTGRTTDLPFDIFAFLSGGAVTLEFLDWTNATTRATGLTRVNGVWTKTGDQTRRYVGSCRARSATTYHWVLSGTDAPVKMDLWNADNRVEVSFNLKATTDTWNYTLATIRQAQGSTNYQVDIMVGLQEDFFEAGLFVTSRNSTISIMRSVGIGFDSTTTFSGLQAATANTVASINVHQMSRIKNQPGIGRHFYSWNEFSVATGTCTWVGDDGTTNPTHGMQSGMSGSWNA